MLVFNNFNADAKQLISNATYCISTQLKFYTINKTQNTQKAD